MKKVKLIIRNINSIDFKTTHIEDLLKNIHPRYREKYLRSKSERVRQQALLSGLLLHQELNLMANSKLIINEYGKPSLADESWHFSLSHSGDYVILAVSDTPVGADIEGTTKGTMKIARKAFPKKWVLELEKLDSVSSPDFQKEFSRYWTLYEASVKLMGCGFAKKVSDEDILQIASMAYTTEQDHYIISIVANQPFDVIIDK